MKRLVSILLALAVCAALAAVVWATSGSVTVVSEPGVDVYGPLLNYKPPYDGAWGTANPAVAISDNRWPSDLGMPWISSAYPVENKDVDSWRWFHDEMTLPCTADNISSGIVKVHADNAEEFWFNSEKVGSDGEVQGDYYDNAEWNNLKEYPISPHAGLNTLDFIVRNYPPYYPTKDGTYYPNEPNPTGLIYEATVNYEVPDVVWQPPVTNDAFELKDGTTLPLKFKLYQQDGTLITSMQNVYMMVHGPGLGDGVRWDLGDGVDSLRFDYCEYYYITNFQTRNYELMDEAWYTAVVHDGCTGQILGYIEFMVSTSKGAGRGNK